MAKDSHAHDHRCFHDDDWDTVLYWNNLDPEVYEQCIQEQCTKSIELYDKGELLFNDHHPIDFSPYGDGSGALLHEIQPAGKRFQGGGGTLMSTEAFTNAVHQSRTACEGVGGYWYNSRCYEDPDTPITGNYGWKHSNVRAVLNGVTDDSLDTNFANYMQLDEEKSVLGSFPSHIKDMIGTRVVVSKEGSTTSTTYDKLWLLSVEEIYGRGNVNAGSTTFSNLNESSMGAAYNRFQGLTNPARANRRNENLYSYSYQPSTAYQPSSQGKVTDCYTLRTTSDDRVAKISGEGILGTSDHTTACALAPAFALKREEPQPDAGEIITTITKDVVVNESTLYNFIIPRDEKIVAITSDKVAHFTKTTDVERRLIKLNHEDLSAEGGTAKLAKNLVVDKYAEIPEVSFKYTIYAGDPVEISDDRHVVYKGIKPEEVLVNGTKESGYVYFDVGEPTINGPTNKITANEKYATKDIVLDFINVKFPEPGVYRYILKEEASTWDAIVDDPYLSRVIDVHVKWNDDETKLIVGGYVGYEGTVIDAPKLLPNFNYTYIDTDGNGEISDEEKEAQKDEYEAAYENFIASIEDGSGHPDGSYVNAYTPIKVEAGTKSDNFLNRVVTKSLTFCKEVTGNQGSKDQYFEFTMTLNGLKNGTILTVNENSTHELSTHKNNATSYSVEDMNKANGWDDIPAEYDYYYPISDTMYNELFDVLGDDWVNAVGEEIFNRYITIDQSTGEDRLLYTIYFGSGEDAKTERDAFKAEHPREDMSSYPQEYLDEFIEDIPLGDGKPGQQLVADENGQIIRKFYLQHGQEITINGIPLNSTYMVDETGVQDGYTVSGEVLTPAVITDDVNVTVINNRSGVVPTGILVSASGAFALLGISVLWFILNIRRKLREE